MRPSATPSPGSARVCTRYVLHFARLLVLAVALLAALPGRAGAEQHASATLLTLWSAYTGKEARALRSAVEAFEAQHPAVKVEVLEVPFGAYASKLRSAIPTGRGPDLFVDAHERLTSYVEEHLVRPLDTERLAAELELRGDGSFVDFDREQVQALRRGQHLYGLPLALKSASLFVNTSLVPGKIESTQDIDALRDHLPNGVVPLVFETDNPYYFAAFVHAAGGELLDERGKYGFVGAKGEAAVAFLQGWQSRGVVPEEPNGELVKRLFSSGRAALAISGPWLAVDLPEGLPWRAQPLPLFAPTSMLLRPYVTVEAVFVSQSSREHALAARLAAFLAGPTASAIRSAKGSQVVASRAASHDNALLEAFRSAALSGTPMPSHPNMSAVWEPAQRSMRKALREMADPQLALSQGERRFDAATSPLPARRSPYLLLAFFGFVLLLCTWRMVKSARQPEVRRRLRASLPAYAYTAHVALAVGLLVVAPLLVGVVVSFFAGRGREMHFVGLANYWDILSAARSGIFGSGSFWMVLLVTILWTLGNLALHVSLGVSLALVLHRPKLLGSKLYRVLLILPWAVPSYVTALCWKGMFHRQFGAINAILHALGAEPVSWFGSFSTAFAANLTTNVWLGFPFMMVITLGALTNIPKDVYEAADVDGASVLERLRHITLPMLRPTLAPAAAMGAVWTFNMFNVVFLVSGGEPDGGTEILVSEAYRWAFTRSSQYGYAAAYAVLIFGILLLSNHLPRLSWPRRIARATTELAPRGALT